MHCRAGYGQWVVQLSQCIATPHGRSGQCNSCNAPPHYLGLVGGAPPVMHCLSPLGQWALQLVHDTLSLPKGSRRGNSYNALPHRPWGRGQCNSCNARAH